MVACDAQQHRSSIEIPPSTGVSPELETHLHRTIVHFTELLKASVVHQHKLSKIAKLDPGDACLGASEAWGLRFSCLFTCLQISHKPVIICAIPTQAT
jgi:hypothetical protein